MTPPLFLLEELPAGDTVLLTGEEGRHAARVKRLGVGERVLVSDGSGAVAECEVAEVLADGLRLEVRSRLCEPMPDPSVTVVQALPKGERADLAVEILTELGADTIVPWSASRSIVRWDAGRAAKGTQQWRRTAREASKQSRRVRVPVVTELAGLAEVTARISSGAGVVLHEAADQHLANVSLPRCGDLVVVVGPEGGVAPEELAALTAAGAVPVRLGDPVLRTSTAGAAALAVLAVRLGRWG